MAHVTLTTPLLSKGDLLSVCKDFTYPTCVQNLTTVASTVTVSEIWLVPTKI